MKRLRAYVPWFGFMLGISFMLAGCAPRKSVVATPPAAPSAPTSRFEAKGYSFVFPPGQSARVWEITAAVTSGSSENGTLVMERVQAVLYRDGKPSLRVTAGRGSVAVANTVSRLILRDGVKAVEASRQLTLQADAIEWTNTGNVITTQRPRWQGEGLVSSADSATFSADLTEGVFHGHVRTTSARK